MNLWPARMRTLTYRTRILLFRLEAVLSLLASYVMLRVLPFRLLERVMNHRSKRREVSGDERRRIVHNVCWALKLAEQALPIGIVCFPRCLATQIMLRRYGVQTTLYYGAASLPQKGLTAHTWLQDGTMGVVDHEQAGHYRLLACYPPRGSGNSVESYRAPMFDIG